MNGTFVDGTVPGHAPNGEQQLGQQSATSANGSRSSSTAEQEHPHTSFWSHLFSFDSGAKASQPYERVIGAARLSQPAIWMSALKSVRLSHLFEGIGTTPNFKFFVLCAGFLGWLFVVDYVRKHEHDSYKMTRQSPDFGAASADRALVSGIKGAFPYEPSASSGSQQDRSSYMASGPGQALSANYNGDQRFGVPVQYNTSSGGVVGHFNAPEPIVPTPVPLQSPAILQLPPQGQAIPRTCDMATPPAYNLQVTSPHGTWLRTIVSR